MTKTIEDLFLYLVAFSDFLIILLFLVFIRKTKAEKGLWVIFSYCLLDLAVNYTLESAPRRLLLLIYTLFTLFEYLLFATFLWLNIKSERFKKGILAATAAFTLFLGFYYTTTTEFRSVDSLPIGVETILILIYTFYYLYEQMNEPGELFIYNKYPFWISSGVMLYLAGSFFIYIFANQVDKKVLAQYWTFTYVFLIIKNILFAIAILIHVKQKKNPSPEKHLYPYLN